jgi:hypothetical protein
MHYDLLPIHNFLAHKILAIYIYIYIYIRNNGLPPVVGNHVRGLLPEHHAAIRFPGKSIHVLTPCKRQQNTTLGAVCCRHLLPRPLSHVRARRIGAQDTAAGFYTAAHGHFDIEKNISPHAWGWMPRHRPSAATECLHKQNCASAFVLDC